jgi:hypothetical protein
MLFCTTTVTGEDYMESFIKSRVDCFGHDEAACSQEAETLQYWNGVTPLIQVGHGSS